MCVLPRAVLLVLACSANPELPPVTPEVLSAVAGALPSLLSLAPPGEEHPEQRAGMRAFTQTQCPWSAAHHAHPGLASAPLFRALDVAVVDARACSHPLL
jgi:hypothetical protein